ncbi:MAG: hypothetical protein KKE50_00540, partial [Nanoarchaeota archaeon]|nr:hypothetical protein [Nanoarchaeota archaeon]
MENGLYNKFRDFLTEIDSEKIESTWMHQSSIFRDFWENRIMKENFLPLTDSEIDEIVLILDKNAKGSTKDTIAVARVLIPQGVWRRLFKEIQSKKELKQILYEILLEKDKQRQIELIDKLYRFNEGKKNSLTGKSGNAINTMLFAFSPEEYLPIVSLNDRKKIIEHFDIDCSIDFENDSSGKKIIESNKIILDGFKKYNIDTKPYILSDFLYKKLRSEWKLIDESISEIPEEEKEQEYLGTQSNFSMEKELENFIITNWDRTGLSKEYELIEEEGEMKSQQYNIDTGDFIDILVYLG